MLTQKDYCDYETCVALKELGYKVPTSAYYMPENSQLIFVINQFRGGTVMDCFYSNNSLPKECMASDFIDAPTMWEAQKWLREEKGFDIIIKPVNKCTIFIGGERYFSMLYRNQERISSLDVPCTITFEESLLARIKEAVELLKEEK